MYSPRLDNHLQRRALSVGRLRVMMQTGDAEAPSLGTLYRAARGQRVSRRVQRAILVTLRREAAEFGAEAPVEVVFGWADAEPGPQSPTACDHDLSHEAAQ